MIKAILYDLDGVLVHAVQIHYDAFNMALMDVSGTSIAPEEEEEFNGLPTKKKLDKLQEWGRVKKADKQVIWEKKQERTIDDVKKNLTYDSDKTDLHIFTRGLGLRSACITNSITDTAQLMLECSGQWLHMDFLISNQMVKRPKPHGEGYIRAMVRMGLQPDDVLIVEDSKRGIEAAKSTSANIWHVKDAHDVTLPGFKKAMAELFGKSYLRELMLETINADR